MSRSDSFIESASSVLSVTEGRKATVDMSPAELASYIKQKSGGDPGKMHAEARALEGAASRSKDPEKAKKNVQAALASLRSSGSPEPPKAPSFEHDPHNVALARKLVQKLKDKHGGDIDKVRSEIHDISYKQGAYQEKTQAEIEQEKADKDQADYERGMAQKLLDKFGSKEAAMAAVHAAMSK